jgi:hypothetical protein
LRQGRARDRLLRPYGRLEQELAGEQLEQDLVDVRDLPLVPRATLGHALPLATSRAGIIGPAASSRQEAAHRRDGAEHRLASRIVPGGGIGYLHLA